MVKFFTISDDANLHKKCTTCKGANLKCEDVIKCDNATCASYYHVDCVSSSRVPDEEELGELEYWYCSDACDAADQSRRDALQKAKGGHDAAAQLQQLMAELEQERLQRAMVESRNLALEEEKAKLAHVGMQYSEANKELNNCVKKLQADLIHSRKFIRARQLPWPSAMRI